MNALRNIFSSRTLNYLRQNGQNALINITQPAVDTAAPVTHVPTADDNKKTQPFLIPRSILDATKFNGKKFDNTAAKPLSLSPTTLKRFRRLERKVELVYRCKLCNTRNTKLVSEAAYTSGVVILQCDGCAVDHLIIDNLGWFANKGKSFNEVLAERGYNVKVIKVNEHGELI